MKNDNFSQRKAEEMEKNNNWYDALIIYQALINEEPNNIVILSKIGWCQSRLKDYNKAINTLKKIIELDPNKAKWYYMVGYQYYAQEDWQNAINWFKKALGIYPEYFIVKYRLGYALTQVSGTIYRLKRTEYLEAFKHFEDCQIIWENMPEERKNMSKSVFADVCFQQGKIYAEREEWEQAIKCFKKTISLKPDSIKAKYQLAKSLNNNEPEEALRVLPENDDKYYIKELRAEIYFNLGKIDESLQILLSCLKKRNKDYLLRQISDICLYKKDLKSAYYYSQKAISLNKNNHKNHLTLGKIYYSSGLLFYARKAVELSINLKKEKYKSEYSEAVNFLENINKDISNKNHVKDDKKLFDQLNNFTIEKDKINKGKILKYNSQKGYGFIKSNSESVFFHISNVFVEHRGNIKAGIYVVFKIENTTRGLSARDIKIKF